MSLDHHHDEHGDRLLESEDFQKARREMRRVLWRPGLRPDDQVSITRRIFIHRALLGGTAAAAATAGWLPRINTMDMAFAQEAGPPSTFRFAWISDTHLYPKEVNTRFVEKAVRAVNDVKAMNPPPDFLIFGGDLAQLGDPVELQLGAEIINELDVRKVFIPGEHDWYLDMGKTWNELFGTSPWTFDHKGVRFIGLDTVSRAMDFWTARNMTPKERMAAMATLDGALGGAWAGLGREQLDFLDKTLSDWGTDRPVVIFSHNPLYEYYPPWNFWVRDWREVHEIVKPYTKITNIHGHTHQVLYNEIGAMRSIGMLATSWPWPYAPEGVPKLTKPMIRVDPGDPFDGVGWGRMTFNADDQRIEHEYMMWRKEVLASTQVDSGTGDNPTTFLSPRPDGR
jgi:predicted MPP superfamily phosphohydrolase